MLKVACAGLDFEQHRPCSPQITNELLALDVLSSSVLPPGARDIVDMTAITLVLAHVIVLKRNVGEWQEQR